MRRWLILFLLTVFPLQFASAAAVAYCLHETDASAKHAGHHEHRHQLPSAKVADDSTRDHKGGLTGAGDPDCEFCHLSCAQPLSPSLTTWAGVRAHAPPKLEPLGFGSRDPDVLDRPNWTLAA